MKSLLFTNWTAKDFTHAWANVPYTFKAGQAMYMEDWKAKHFAKHLVNRELNEQGIATNHFSRAALEEKCISDPSVEDVPVSKMATELLNKNVEKVVPSQEVTKQFCEQCTSKGGRHLKTCPTVQKVESVEPSPVMV